MTVMDPSAAGTARGGSITRGRATIQTASAIAICGRKDISPGVAVLRDSTIGMMTAAEDDAINTA
ncbi:hypothetical protein SRABI91_00670 [Rhodococcoides fascians]|nr:hypothetical protein SRABI91_00670 [Rhodococcus fascians]